MTGQSHPRSLEAAARTAQVKHVSSATRPQREITIRVDVGPACDQLVRDIDAAIARANGPALERTEDPPIEDGHYWAKLKQGSPYREPRIFRLMHNPDRCWPVDDDCHWNESPTLFLRWSVRLEPPK